MPHRPLSRRSLLRSSALLAAAAGLPQWFVDETAALAAEAKPATSANDKPNVLLIGCGGRGLSVAKGAKPFLNIVAVCDVDEKHVANATSEFPGVAEYHDFRKAVAHKGIDAVICATPDHWHTLISIHAMRQGKDVYCEKPLTLTIDEGKKLIEVASQTKRILQTGSQQRSDANFRLACELVRNGRLGKLKQAIASIPAGRREGPFKPSPVPKELDWDLWQGQAPAHEYVKERCHTTFRYFYDYSGGTTTDWGAHHNDIAHWGVGQDGPVAVEGKALVDPIPGGYTAVPDFRIVYTYANGVEQICHSQHYDDGFGRPIAQPPAGETRNGVKFVGENGWIYVTRGKIEASDPELLKQELPASAERLYVSNSHFGNFVDCIRSRKPAICSPEVGHRSASMCHLGNIAIRLGRKLKWDPIKEQFEGDAEAQAMTAREMRKPWGYEAV